MDGLTDGRTDSAITICLPKFLWGHKNAASLKCLLLCVCIKNNINMYKAPVTLTRFKPRFTTTHPDLRLIIKSGCIGMRRDGKKEIPASIRCLTMLLRCLHDSSKTHEGRATIHHGGATNARDASTIRYDVSTIQAGSATVAPRPPTNVHDLVVGM